MVPTLADLDHVTFLPHALEPVIQRLVQDPYPSLTIIAFRSLYFYMQDQLDQFLADDSPAVPAASDGSDGDDGDPELPAQRDTRDGDDGDPESRAQRDTRDGHDGDSKSPAQRDTRDGDDGDPESRAQRDTRDGDDGDPESRAQRDTRDGHDGDSKSPAQRDTRDGDDDGDPLGPRDGGGFYTHLPGAFDPGPDLVIDAALLHRLYHHRFYFTASDILAHMRSDCLVFGRDDISANLTPSSVAHELKRLALPFHRTGQRRLYNLNFPFLVWLLELYRARQLFNAAHFAAQPAPNLLNLSGL